MPELSPEDSQRVQEIAKSLQEEFASTESDPFKRSTLQGVEDLKEDSLATLKHSIKHSESESLRTKIAMWAVEKLLEQNKAADGMTLFLEGMAAAKDQSAASNNS